jgi:tetratricopeptide (TPR) repeat protein
MQYLQEQWLILRAAWPPLVAALAVLCASTAPAQAQDDVVYRRNGIIDRGTIVSQDAAGVRMIRTDSKREILIPADQVERVQVKLTAQQEQGEKLFEEKDYGAAAQKFAEALKAEPHRWLRVRIASSLVACHVAAGDSVAAIQAFFENMPPDGQFGPSAVPLRWVPETPPAPVVRHAASMVQSSQPLEQLIAASFLFGTNQSDAARGVLNNLATNRDERVGLLARLQLWRWEVATADAQAIASWQRQLARIAPESRGGPYLVIGLALDRIGQPEDAALAYLWPALVVRNDPRLSARAAVLAAAALERANQRDEAVQLYGEVAARYASFPEANTAQKRIDALKE